MNNIMILGAAGFIGTNLARQISKNKENYTTLVDKNKAYFALINRLNLPNTKEIVSALDIDMDFSILEGQEVVYHLVSTNVPTNSNRCVSHDIEANVLFSARLFEECVKYGVKKVVFISSGGTVYGKEAQCPLSENTPTNPITSYGLQKLTIEKLLYLYSYMYGLDYRIIRLANPYGPFQRPNGILGAVTTFTYKALKEDTIIVYGDGSIIRDFIYIDDAVRGILNIVDGESKHFIFNLGSGQGTSIKELLEKIRIALNCNINIVYKEGRSVDVPVNYLDISRYEMYYGKLNPTPLIEGIQRTAEFMKTEFL